MPCRCDDGPPVRDEVSKKDKTIANLEEMLCSACTQLDTTGFNFALNPMLDKWWHKHKEEDNRRILLQLKVQQELDHCKELLQKPLLALSSEDKAMLKKHKLL